MSKGFRGRLKDLSESKTRVGKREGSYTKSVVVNV